MLLHKFQERLYVSRISLLNFSFNRKGNRFFLEIGNLVRIFFII